MGGSISRTTRAATVSGEDASHTHRRRVRFPRLEFPEVLGSPADQAEQEKRESVLRQGQGDRGVAQDGEAGGPHPATESSPARLGAVPPPGGRQGDVQQTRLATVVAVDTLGTSQASDEEPEVGGRE